jgi:hypothetical protein
MPPHVPHRLSPPSRCSRGGILLGLAAALLATAVASHPVGAAVTPAVAVAAPAVMGHHHAMIPGPQRRPAGTNGVYQTTATTSYNWSGYALTGPTGAFSSVTGCWTVPTVLATSYDSYSSSWVGIDGMTDLSHLIQAGTDQFWIGSQAVYHAWWEILPASETAITSLTISAGDAMCAAIQGSGGSWTITVWDHTTGAEFATTQSYSGAADSAEWITEAPATSSGSGYCILPLADYQQVSFEASANDSPASLASASAERIQMLPTQQPTACNTSDNANNNSTPSVPSSAGYGFNDAYGTTQPSPPTSPTAPTVSSVSPTSGSGAGGQAVAIGGTGFEAGAVVAFGPTLSGSVTLTGTSHISAVTPPGQGTVNVMVLNPDGGVGGQALAFAYMGNVGAPVAVLAPGGGTKLVFWRGAGDNHLDEAVYSISAAQWSGPVDLTAALGVPSSGDLTGAPAVIFTPDGGQLLVFWPGANGDLWEAWYTYSLGYWLVQDLTAANGLQGAGSAVSTPSVTFTPGGGQQLVFWRGSNDDLWEAWYTVALSRWYSEDLSTGLLGGAGQGTLASSPTVILTPGGGQQLTFWEGTNSHVWEAWYTVATYSWNVQDLTAARFPGAASTASSPDALLTPGAGQQLIFYQAAGTGDLWEAWYTVATYTWNAQDLSTAHLGGAGSLASGPVVRVISGGGQQVVFWQTSGGHLDEAWYTVASYTWAIEDVSAAAGIPSTGALASAPSVLVLPSGALDAFWQSATNNLWEADNSGGWSYSNLGNG